MRSPEGYPGYIPGSRLVRRGAERLANVLSHVKVDEISRTNLCKAVTLWEQGMEAAAFSSHDSDADGLAVNLGIRKGGAPEFADELFIGMGDKIRAKFIRGFVSRRYPQVILPQTDGPIVKRRNGTYQRLLEEAVTTIPRLMADYKVFFTFIGGTRSLDGVLTEGRAQLAHYFTDPDNTFILPIALDGTREAWPRESRPRFFRDIHVYFGEPIMVGEIIRQIESYERETGRNIDNPTRNAIIVDTVLRQGIAPLINSERRGIYGDRQVSSTEWVMAHPRRKK
jgi:hypothetical protein